MIRNTLRRLTEQPTPDDANATTELGRRRLLRNTAGAGALLVGGFTTLSGTAAAFTWPTYSRGDVGENVRTIQYLLYTRGHGLSSYDGIYGPETESAVESFQSGRGLTVDGIVGPQTWSALISTVSRGDSNMVVGAVQVQLEYNHGYDITIDTIFGPETENAVRSFQSSRNITVDGIVGPQTWRALVST